MNVYAKLNEARDRFHALKLTKTGHNKFAGYYYFELGDFLIPALKVFRDVGLCGTITFGKEVAKMCVVNVEKPDEYIPFESPMGSAALKGCHEVQNVGAVETYQRRYLWVAALEIVEHDALDATTGRQEEPTKTASKQTTKPGADRGGVAGEVLASSPALDAETARYLDELAVEVVAAFQKGGAKGGFERIEIENLDHLQKIYLSTKLASGVRNPITAYSREFHNAKKQAA